MKDLLRKITVGSFAIALLSGRAYADDLSYDRYAPVYREEPASASAAEKLFTHFLVYPFELVRWPVEQGLYYTEKWHLDDKFQWVYDEIQSYGITPQINAVSISNFGYGVELDAIRLIRQKENFPDTTFKGWWSWTDGVRRNAGAKAGWERINGTGFHVFGIFDYENRVAEAFYGIGPDTSAGERSVYSMETTTLMGMFGYSPDPRFETNFNFGYRNINISDGRDGGSGQRGGTRVFTASNTPGFFGDSILTYELEFIHDTRNQKANSTKGGRRRIAASYNEGLNSSEARYFRYEAEASQYFRLGSDRRVLAVRARGEHNDEVDDKIVPFHRMSRLGGHGVQGTRLSHTLRGFDDNRFYDESSILFNIEYRYTVWEYRDLKADAVFFWDEGQVFGEFSEFQFKDFRESYGLGMRFSIANVVLLSLEAAHGDEGTNFYFKSHAPF